MELKHEIKLLENSAAELKITLPADMLEEAYQKTLKDYSKKITLKGFRKGMAPASLVQSKFGDSIREETYFKVMEDNLETVYKELEADQRPLPFSTPVLQKEEDLLPFKAGEDLTYSVIYDIKPKFELPEYKDLTVEVEEKKVTKKDVDEEIEKLRDQNALIIEKDGKAEKGDIITLDYAELDADGKEIENTKRNDFTFTIGSSYNFYKIDEDVVGLAKDDEKLIEKTYSKDSGMDPAYLDRTIKLQVKVKQVKRKDIPELDDDFAQDVKEEYKTVDDLLNDTKKKLQERADAENKNAKFNAIMGKLTDAAKIEVPESMIKLQMEQEWRGLVNRFGMTEDQLLQFLQMQGQTKEQYLESMRESVINNIKGELILEEIKNAEKFEATDEEILATAKKIYGDEFDEKNENWKNIKDYTAEETKFQKAQDFIVEKNTFVKPKEEKKETKKADKKTEKEEK